MDTILHAISCCVSFALTMVILSHTHLINSQKVKFPFPLYWENKHECQWRKSFFFFFKWKRIRLKNSHTKFHACICCGLFVRASESWKNHYFAGREKKRHTKWVLPFSCNFIQRMQGSIQLFFLHIAEEIFLYQTCKLWVIESIFYTFFI